MFKTKNLINAFAVLLISLLVVKSFSACGGGGGGGSNEPEPPITDVPMDLSSPITSPAVIHPKVGFSAFAIQSSSWDCDGFLNSIDSIREWHFAFLYHTFGDNNSCLSRMLQSEKLKTIQVHLINEVCQRHDLCFGHEFLANISERDWENRLAANDQNLIQSIQGFAIPMANFLANNLKQGVECFISPSLESNLSNPVAINNLINALKPIFPTCGFVWNGLETGTQRFNAEYLELHGNRSAPSPCVANLDGVDISFPERPSGRPTQMPSSDIEGYFVKTANCEVGLLWVVESNCAPADGQISQNPRERFCGNKNFIYNLQMNHIRDWQESHLPGDLQGTPILPSIQ